MYYIIDSYHTPLLMTALLNLNILQLYKYLYMYHMDLHFNHHSVLKFLVFSYHTYQIIYEQSMFQLSISFMIDIPISNREVCHQTLYTFQNHIRLLYHWLAVFHRYQ